MNQAPPSPRRSGSPLRVALGLLLVGGLSTFAVLGGRSLARVRRDEAALARIRARPPTALLELRADEDRRLAAGPISIDEAMRRLARDGRLGLGSALTPRPSNDTAPLMGWAFKPHDVPEWMLAAAPTPSAAPASPPAPPPVPRGARRN